MLLRYIRGKCEPDYPALYSVFYKHAIGSRGPIYDGLARWTGETFGRVNTPDGELVGGETEIIAFFQFPSALQENNYARDKELRAEKRREETRDRQHKAFCLRKEGHTYRQIAKLIGLVSNPRVPMSVERARQLTRKGFSQDWKQRHGSLTREDIEAYNQEYRDIVLRSIRD